MTDTSTCYALDCGTEVEGTVATCPKCGKPMKSSATVRRLGWIQLFAGIFLIVFMGVITLNLLPLLTRPGLESASGNTFTGNAGQAKMILGLFAAVIVFGFGAAINGGLQIATGRRNRPITIVTLLMATGLVAYALFTTMTLKS